MRCGNQKVIGTFDSLLLYGSRYVSEILAATDHRSLSLWRYVLDMLAATGICLYGGMCTTIQCGVVSYMFRSIDRR